MAKPTFDSLRIKARVGRENLIYKEAQEAGGPPGGMPPDVGQSPVTGNPDEMQAPESASQRQYEDDFGNLAYQFAQDRASALIPYMIGFEVVDRNEDGSKAVGIFGYKVDDDFYYIPCFFLNNQIRGMDMVLNKKTNQFVPLTETWIDFIINRHSVSIGGPADDRVRETMRNPDLSFVQRPQVGIGKVAESAPWTFGEAWRQIKSATAKMARDPAFVEMLSGATGCVEKKAESTYIRSFMEKVGGPEAMSSFLSALHDADFANAAMTLYKDAEAFWTPNLKEASGHVNAIRKIASAYPDVLVVDKTEGLEKFAQDAPAADVGEEDKPLSQEENARQILDHDFTIVDIRKEDAVSRVSDDKALVDFEHRFQPPDGPGRYNFVMSDGEAREGILLNCVMSPEVNDGSSLVCFEDGGTVLASAPSTAMITTNFEDDAKPSEDDAVRKMFDEATPISDVEVDARNPVAYIFVDGKGNAAGPFGLKFVMFDADHIRIGSGYVRGDAIVKTSVPDGLETSYGFMDWNLRDRFHDSDGRPGKDYGHCGCCGDIPCESCGWGDIISVGSFSGMPKKTSLGVIIPHDWKAVKVRSLYSYVEWNKGETDEEHARREAEQSAEVGKIRSKYTFGTVDDILETMRNDGVERIKVASDGVDFFVSVDGAKVQHGPMNYKQASIDLVTRFGLRPRRAFSTLDKAASAGESGVRLLVGVPSLCKKAQDGLVNVAMPAPAEQLPSIDPYSGIPVYTSPYIDVTHGSFTGVPGLPPEKGLTHGINFGGEMERNMGGEGIPDEHTDSLKGQALPLDEEARRLAEEAAAAGQRHVFDQAAIGGLAKVYDTMNVVDSYIPEFMDTIDRLGRILFLFYWKHEDFNQRYGSDDVVQMEDRLRSVFKQLGELALQLKEKSVNKE